MNATTLTSDQVQMLERLRKEIEHFSRTTESMFLNTGDRLRGFLSECRRIHGLETAITEQIAEGKGSRLTARLEDLLKDTRRFVGVSSHTVHHEISTLTGIRDELKQLPKALRHMEMLVKRLTTLSMSTKVNCAHMNAGRKQFLVVAGRISDSAKAIEQKILDIHGGQAQIREMLGGVLLSASHVEEEQEHVSHDVIKEIAEHIEALKERREQSRGIAGDLTQETAEIKSHMEQMVMSMQFHDITRQRLEHIVEGLNDLILRDQSGDGEGVVKLKVILCAQLDEALTEFNTAVATMVDSLGNLGTHIDSMNHNVTTFLMSSDQEAGSYFSDAHARLKEIGDMLQDSGDSNRDLADIVQVTGETIAQMSDHAAAIENLGEDIRMTAINAQILAENLSAEGQGLGVREVMRAIAKSIQELSVQTQDYRLMVSDKLSGIANRADLLVQEAVHQTEEVDHEMQDMTGLLEKLFQELDGLSRQGQSAFGEIQDGSAALSSELAELAQDLSIWRKRECGLEAVRQDLKQAVASLNFKPGDLSGDDLDAFSARYTMERERQTHNQALGAEESGANVDDLDDNIELF